MTRLVAQDYLSAFDGKNIDTLILGCTHYTLLYNLIDRLTDYRLRLIDAGSEAALSAKDFLAKNGLLSAKKQGGMKFFVTDKVEGFSRLGREFLGEELCEVTRIDPEDLVK